MPLTIHPRKEQRSVEALLKECLAYFHSQISHCIIKNSQISASLIYCILKTNTENIETTPCRIEY